MENPEGWKTHRIADIAVINVGRDLVEDSFSRKKTPTHQFPVYSNTVEEHGVYGFYDFEEYQGNCLTIVGRGIGLGTAFARTTGFGAIGRLLVLSPKPKRFDAHYFAEYVNSYLRIYYESGGIPQLPGSTLAKYKVLLPPLSEQKKIAEILSTWDRAIEVVEGLIENSQAQKKALMQQLLTGKKRLPGCEGEWGFFSFSGVYKIANNKKTQVTKREYSNEGKTPIVDQGQKLIVGFTNKNETYTNIPVIIFGDHTRIIKWVDFEFCPGADGTQILSVQSGFDLQFCYYLLQNTDIPNLGYSRHMRELKEREFRCPIDLNEQIAISTILQSAEHIEKSSKILLLKLKSEKSALMQQLLTGKRRVKIKKEAEDA